MVKWGKVGEVFFFWFSTVGINNGGCWREQYGAWLSRTCHKLPGIWTTWSMTCWCVLEHLKGDQRNCFLCFPISLYTVDMNDSETGSQYCISMDQKAGPFKLDGWVSQPCSSGEFWIFGEFLPIPSRILSHTHHVFVQDMIHHCVRKVTESICTCVHFTRSFWFTGANFSYFLDQ